jgi:glycosyltransferase involved in cell wall biosynthesis
MKGGVGRYAYHLAHALANKGNIDIHIAVSRRYGKMIAPEISHECKFNDTNYKYSLNNDITDESSRNKYLVYNNIIEKGDGGNSNRLLDLVKRIEPDIVHIQYERGLYEIDSTVPHLLKSLLYGSTLDKFYKRCPVPTVSTLHTIIPRDEYQEYVRGQIIRKGGRFSRLPLPIRATIRKWVMKRRYDLLLDVVEKSTEVINLSKTTRDVVKRGTIIYHGSQPALSSNKQRFREELGLPNDKRLLLAFGYAGSYKGFEILNQVTIPNDWLLVVKQNKHDRGIEQPVNIENALSLHDGYLDEILLSKLFFSCDAIIFPYRVTSISGVLFDALAHGLPFVASDLKFFNEFAEMGLGKTCKRNAISFSESIDFLASNYDMFKRNVRHFGRKAIWENIANKHIALYLELLH